MFFLGYFAWKPEKMQSLSVLESPVQSLKRLHWGNLSSCKSRGKSTKTICHGLEKCLVPIFWFLGESFLRCWLIMVVWANDLLATAFRLVLASALLPEVCHSMFWKQVSIACNCDKECFALTYHYHGEPPEPAVPESCCIQLRLCRVRFDFRPWFLGRTAAADSLAKLRLWSITDESSISTIDE